MINQMMFPILSICYAIQLSALAATILQRFPAASTLKDQVLSEWQNLLLPEWETWIFRFFVFCALFGSFILIRFKKEIRPIEIITEVLLTGLIVSALFKQAVYADRPQLATYMLYGLFIFAVIFKFASHWAMINSVRLVNFVYAPANATYVRQWATVGMIAIIFLIIDIPDLNATLAGFFFGEQFHHNDSFIYGPAFAYSMGNDLNVQTISQYGVGVGVFFALLGKLAGGFNYETGLGIMVKLTALYYILMFLLIRRWLASFWIAAAAVLLMIKWQMFHQGVYPNPFTYGSATPMRHLFDIFFYWGLLLHVYKRSWWAIGMAALACACQLFYIPSEGVYLSAAFISYLLMLFVIDGRSAVKHLGWLVFIAAGAALLGWVFIGPAVLQKLFWQNTKEFVEYFLNGFGVTPIYSSLLDRQFLASLIGFCIPIGYVLTLSIIVPLLILKKIDRRHVFTAVVCVYGLCVYHYYIARSAVNSYYTVSVPWVMLLAFVSHWVIGTLDIKYRRKALVSVFILCAWALCSNQQFIAYPNRLNVSRNPHTSPVVKGPLPGTNKPYFHHLFREYNPQLKVPVNSLNTADEGLISEWDFKDDDQLVAYYRQESDFSMDAALIQERVSKDKPAALISSFEIKILMQAERKPYFYYFPLIISHPMRSRTLVRSSIYTTDQFAKVIQAIERDAPEYVFVERSLLTRPLSEEFYYYYSSALYLVDYVLTRYAPEAQGQYLVSLKRKVPS